MGDVETMSKKGQETKKIRKRVNASTKKQKKPKKKVRVEDDVQVNEAIIEKMVTTLMCNTELSEAAIRSQYSSFMKECPAGEMSKEKFVQLSETVLGDEAQFLADSLFRVFDDDGSGTMDFQEYIMALNATKLTTPEEKLKWIFNVFDRDGGGSIDAGEIQEMVGGLFAMAGAEIGLEELLDCTEEIMAAIDVDGDGDITRDEFIEHAPKSQFIANMLNAE
eukprot:GFUD01014709.1.p1 GENE.GFUD01014709.1~~GFUD01014709.1.p1  ORF type:complete len:221 (+),score=70.16 GFUD01014709.1:66-728(+)